MMVPISVVMIVAVLMFVAGWFLHGVYTLDRIAYRKAKAEAEHLKEVKAEQERNDINHAFVIYANELQLLKKHLALRYEGVWYEPDFPGYYPLPSLVGADGVPDVKLDSIIYSYDTDDAYDHMYGKTKVIQCKSKTPYSAQHAIRYKHALAALEGLEIKLFHDGDVESYVNEMCKQYWYKHDRTYYETRYVRPLPATV